MINGASMSKPHTSGKSGKSIAIKKIYVEIWIDGKSIMRSQSSHLKIG